LRGGRKRRDGEKGTRRSLMRREELEVERE
jgi:hypothetical protein